MFFLSYLITYIISNSFSNALFFAGEPFDGSFQLFNGLKRLSLNEVIGKDFFAFHGNGTLLLHYPLYVIFGSNLFSSEFVRWILSLSVFNFLNFFMFRSIKISKYYSIVLTLIFSFIAVSFNFDSVYLPINSLLGIRTLLPLLLIVVLYNKQSYFQKLSNDKNFIKRNFFEIIVSIFCALSLYTSTEQGISIIIACLVTIFFLHPTKVRLLNRVKSILSIIIITIITLLFVSFIFSGKDFFNALKFNFIEVPTDQYWYFGNYPQYFVKNLSELFVDLRLIYRVLIAIILILFTYSFKSKTKSINNFESFGINVLLIYGMLSSLIPYLGIPNFNYSDNLFRIILFVIIYLVIKVITYKLKDVIYIFSGPGLKIVTILILLFCFTSFEMEKNLPKLSLQVLKYQNYSPTSEKILGSVIEDSYIKYIWGDAFSIIKDCNVYSFYTTLIEAKNNCVSNNKVDYIIHTLGKDLRNNAYVNFINQKPKYFLNPNREGFLFGEWLEIQHWDIIEEVLLNYSLYSKTPLLNFWTRNSNSWVFANTLNKDWSLNTINTTGDIVIPFNWDDEEALHVISITVEYDIKNKLELLPYIKNMTRYELIPDGDINSKYHIALPPYNKSSSFPIITKGKSGNIVISKYVLPFGSFQDFKINNVSYSKLPNYANKEALKIFTVPYNSNK